MTYDVEHITVRRGAWDRTGFTSERIRLHDPEPHPLNEEWSYDPESGIVVDTDGRQVGVDFDGRVHDDKGRELDAYGDPIAQADGTPIPPPDRSGPAHTGRSSLNGAARLRSSQGVDRHRLARKYSALRR